MKKFFSFIFLFLIILAAIGYILPTEYSVTKSITISATPEEIHQYVGDLEKWNSWTPWTGEDPDIEISLSEITTGIGASQSWTDKHGGGSLLFTSSSPSNGIEYDLFFQAGKYTSKASINYESRGKDATKVIWQLNGDTNTPIIGGYFSLLLRYSIGKMFQTGLDKLKAILEKDS